MAKKVQRGLGRGLGALLGDAVETEETAITIGLYPDISREKFCILGNSSLGGAIKTLLDRDCIRRVNEICARTTYVQFGEMDRFVENMVAAQFIPHTDASLYPSVKRRIQN